MFRSHFACFRCRKVFRKSIVLDWKDAFTRQDAPWAKCPECGHSMHHTSPRFKAPPCKDLKGWADAREYQRAIRADVLGMIQERQANESPGQKADRLPDSHSGKREKAKRRKRLAIERGRKKKLVRIQDRMLAEHHQSRDVAPV